MVKKSSIATDPTSEGKNEFQMSEDDLLGINFNIHGKYKFAKLHFVSIRHSTQERQEMLKSQYHFTCACNSCSEKELIHSNVASLVGAAAYLHLCDRMLELCKRQLFVNQIVENAAQ